MLRPALALLAALVASACATWTPVRSGSSWTLFVKDGEPVDVERFGCGLERAFEAVEERLGPFDARVRVHAWDGDAQAQPGSAPPIPSEGAQSLQYVPGIGPARVRAFHVKGGPLMFQSTGVFLGTCDVGTAVHELVHARLAEEGKRLPLWFEEGLASFLGDGACFGGRWRFDGLACWPLRELREQHLDDDELAQLLALGADDEYDARQNLLVHFVGWAIVFDLAREAPQADWRQWLATFQAESAQSGRLEAAKERLQRTIGAATEDAWLERLRSPEAGVRFATVKGLWKLRSMPVVDRLLDALQVESDREVKVALALNVLLAISEVRLGRTRWGRVSALVFPALREATLPAAEEQAALRSLLQTMRNWDAHRDRNSQQALDALSRYWEE